MRLRLSCVNALAAVGAVAAGVVTVGVTIQFGGIGMSMLFG